jgi:nucleotide sugar dehydrogenase
MTYRDALLSSQYSAGVWGIGYIGFSSILHLVDRGVTAVGYDTNPSRVADINAGRFPAPGIENWTDLRPAPYLERGLLRATIRIEDILDPKVLVHLVAVPTERNGRPWWEPLTCVIHDLATALAAGPHRALPPLVIIESTLTPGTTDELILPALREHGLRIGEDILVGVAPRRDWFSSADRNLEKVDRVCCGVDRASAEATRDVLSLVCSHLHMASHYRSGEMVKCVENAYRHLEIVMANQLSLAYPDVDICEVLQLASTKWNMGFFQPGFGTGGYCIPLAGQYLIEGARDPDALGIVAKALADDVAMRHIVAEAVVRRGCRNVGILGLSYRGDLKVTVMSPALLIARSLVELGANVKVNDPLYTPEEITAATGVPAFSVPDDLHQFDALVVNAVHSRYSEPDVRSAILALSSRQLLIDSQGQWNCWPWPEGAQYFRAGSAGWLGGAAREAKGASGKRASSGA